MSQHIGRILLRLAPIRGGSLTTVNHFLDGIAYTGIPDQAQANRAAIQHQIHQDGKHSLAAAAEARSTYMRKHICYGNRSEETNWEFR